jgi:hypothetical protein
MGFLQGFEPARAGSSARIGDDALPEIQAARYQVDPRSARFEIPETC